MWIIVEIGEEVDYTFTWILVALGLASMSHETPVAVAPTAPTVVQSSGLPTSAGTWDGTYFRVGSSTTKLRLTVRGDSSGHLTAEFAFDASGGGLLRPWFGNICLDWPTAWRSSSAQKRSLD